MTRVTLSSSSQSSFPHSNEASIILLGLRGTGKTSLAILAAGCTGFRLVDADQNFYAVTGLPRAVYASKHGFEEYRRREVDLMRSLLESNPSRCIIVCGPGSAEGSGQELLEGLKKRHPVIYILRDADEVDQHLRTHNPSKISRLSQLITPSYRSLSNFEFYNLSEPVDSQIHAALLGAQMQPHPSLMLKHVEQDFARLIRTIRSQDTRPSFLEARHSLSFLPPELKTFTYALTIPLENAVDLAPKLRRRDLIADALELVIDLRRLVADGTVLDQNAATQLTKQYYTLRRNIRLPVIVHIELPDSALLATSSTASSDLKSIYFNVLSHSLRLAPEYITIDLRCDSQAAQTLIGGNHVSKLIGHFMDTTPGRDGWSSPSRLRMLEVAKRWGCSLVRICQPHSSPNDNDAVQRFRAVASDMSSLPLIAYNTGRVGRNSCYINQILTPVTLDLNQAGTSQLSNEMLTVQDAQRALFASFVLDPLVFGIFGSAVTSAMSPVMHNAAYEYCGMPHRYRTYQSPSLHGLHGIAHDPNFGGLSISAPFKKDIITVLDHISPEAQAIRAVNTVIPLRSQGLESLVERNRAGPVVALYGDNTDWIGIHTCIRNSLSPVNAVKNRTTALILGAGGMAQAAVYASIRLGVRTIFIYNRTPANAEKVVDQFHGKEFPLRNLDWSPTHSAPNSGSTTPVAQKTDKAAVHAIASMDEPWPAGIDPPTIIVSCIDRAGRDGQPPPDIVLPEAWLTSPTGGVVIELAYNPIDSSLLRQARSLSNLGWISVHGLEVLPEQGIAQFELFTGRKAPQHVMRSQVAQRVKSGMQSPQGTYLGR